MESTILPLKVCVLPFPSFFCQQQEKRGWGLVSRYPLCVVVGMSFCLFCMKSTPRFVCFCFSS